MIGGGVNGGIMMINGTSSTSLRIVPPPLYPKTNHSHSHGHHASNSSHHRPTASTVSHAPTHNKYLTGASNGNSYHHISYQQYQMMQQPCSLASSPSVLPSLMLPQPTLASSLQALSQLQHQTDGGQAQQGQQGQQQVSQVEDIPPAKRTKTF